jgi:hypothetical protein
LVSEFVIASGIKAYSASWIGLDGQSLCSLLRNKSTIKVEFNKKFVFLPSRIVLGITIFNTLIYLLAEQRLRQNIFSISIQHICVAISPIAFKEKSLL